MKAIDPRAVLEHLDKIASSTQFADSERLRRFLRFTVEAKLAGHTDKVKEYVLGREVFDRATDYDTRIDPIVRVEARRLRLRLAEYYSSAGRHESIRVDYPKGTYLPQIQPAENAAFKGPFLGAVVVAFIAGALVFSSFPRLSAPMVAVIPMQFITSNHEDLDALGVPLAESISSQLANSGAARVVAWPLLQEKRASFTSIQEAATRLGAAQEVLVIARRSSTLDSVTIFLMDSRTGQKMRAERYDVPQVSITDGSLASRIVRDLRGRAAALP